MGIYLNPGNEGFKRALRSKIYVDKTGLLEYTNSILETEQCCICVSRPRRFGKSITAEMLVSYYDRSCDSREMFCGLEIGSFPDFEKYLNHYDVIHIDMNTFRHKRNPATGEEVSALESVGLFHSEIIKELKEAYGNIVQENDVDLPGVLTKIGKTAGTKFIIVIDEWDTIFREDKHDERAQKAYINLLRGLFKDSTSKFFIALGYLTGILPIKKYGTESALNNFDEFTMIHAEPLTEYVGFTENEVKDLYQEYHMDFDEAQKWYDGYTFSEGIHIYNPKSVVDSIRRKKITSYWSRTETYESLKSYINMNFDGLRDSIVQMLAGARCKVNTETFENDMTSFSSRDDILTVLIHLGYLAYDSTVEEVYIPNEEIRTAFANAVRKCGWTPVIDAINSSEKLLQCTWDMDEEAVAKGIEQVHMDNTSILQYNDENAMSCVISLAYYHAVSEYTLLREFPTGKGFADIVFLPRKCSDKPAMIVELKYDTGKSPVMIQIFLLYYSRLYILWRIRLAHPLHLNRSVRMQPWTNIISVICSRNGMEFLPCSIIMAKKWKRPVPFFWKQTLVLIKLRNSSVIWIPDTSVKHLKIISGSHRLPTAGTAGKSVILYAFISLFPSMLPAAPVKNLLLLLLQLHSAIQE